MKWQLLTYNRQVLGRILKITVITVFSGILCVSCNQNQDVLVTEIGVSPPNRLTPRTSKAGEFYIQGQ
ncbi:MAG: hypothetical protein ACKPCP_20450, partial [Sphaerospermopsis kisseleviana]